MTTSRPHATAPATHDLTALPGVRHLARRIAEDLAAGHSCLLILPTCASATGDDLLRAALSDHTPHKRIPAPGALPAPDPAHPNDEPVAPLWSGQPPQLDLDDTFLLDAMTAAFGDAAALSPAPAPPRPRHAPDRIKSLEARLESLLPPRPADSDPTDDVYRRLSAHHADGCTYVLHAASDDDPDDLARLLQRLPATAKALGLAPEQRPKLLVVATTDRLPATAPDDLARTDVAVHWWWGALGRVDTASVTAVNRPLPARTVTHSDTGRTRIGEALTQATIVEVCGPYLDLAAALAARWDGQPETLRATLTALCSPGPLVLPAQRTPARRTGAHAHQPPDALRLRWNNGTIDAWEGQLRTHPAELCTPGGDTELNRLLWVAQSRTLLPLIDDARDALVTQVLPTASCTPQQLLSMYATDRTVGGSAPLDARLQALELGALYSAKTNAHLAFTPPQTSTLLTLREARNELSHRRHLSGKALTHLITKLSP
ncbi:hypothetical protein PUR71_07315 [Streptomyces sp. SP17BM10]|uniref:hypothetical protein n=1 Tax=Streptomyces sp. SP17BM10 TaxID=3002530 RepID=UPI002E762D00|nr:hypothetical protein [Streptomyces sp. SP17BM10]MEE1782730.1 hypothetical protein [Streptomyces sp. SP17BM10]